MPKLRTLWLDATQLTDAGLAQLKGLSTLKNLSLTKTKVTSSGVEALRKALPQVAVER